VAWPMARRVRTPSGVRCLMTLELLTSDIRWNVPVGAPVVSPIIKNLATEEQQAGNTSDNAFYMLQSGSAYDAFPGLDIGLTRINLPHRGVDLGPWMKEATMTLRTMVSVDSLSFTSAGSSPAGVVEELQAGIGSAAVEIGMPTARSTSSR
jgi:hypothetical protein